MIILNTVTAWILNARPGLCLKCSSVRPSLFFCHRNWQCCERPLLLLKAPHTQRLLVKKHHSCQQGNNEKDFKMKSNVIRWNLRYLETMIPLETEDCFWKETEVNDLPPTSLMDLNVYLYVFLPLFMSHSLLFFSMSFMQRCIKTSKHFVEVIRCPLIFPWRVLITP